MNIAQHVERAARFFPGHPAILFEGTTIGYADLNAGVNRLASALMAHGVKAGPAWRCISRTRRNSRCATSRH